MISLSAAHVTTMVESMMHTVAGGQEKLPVAKRDEDDVMNGGEGTNMAARAAKAAPSVVQDDGPTLERPLQLQP